MPSPPETIREVQKRYRECNRESINARKRAAYHRNPEKHQARARDYRKANYDAILAMNRAYGVKWRARIRAEMIEAYGSECVCCGETELLFLQLDHKNNDGAKSRKEANANGAEYWLRLKRRGWPKDRYQLLCANCNFGRYLNGGICPHMKDQ